MATKADELKTFAFTEADINLITFALRRLFENSSFKGTRDDSVDLINHIERMQREHFIEAQREKNFK